MIIDMTEKTCGKWHIKYYNKHTHKWVCECACGTVREITGVALRSGRTKSCGCAKYKPHGNTTGLINKKYNSLTVIAFDHYDSNKKAYWRCRCDCGRETIVQGYNLIKGLVKICGCSRKSSNFEDIIGSRFGMLTVSRFIERRSMHSYYECVCDCGNHIIANANNLKRGHYYSCGCAHSSKEESDVLEYVRTLTNDIKTNIRILDGKEIDIYIPSKKLGIEYNGSIYHATENSPFRNRAKNYHRDKFLVAKEHDIHLITIFDVDWHNKQEKIKNYLRDLLVPARRIFARKCLVDRISKSTANDFCDRYHLQGATNLSSINYGLFHNNELVSIMTFGRLRLKKQIEGHYELHRYCVCSGITVVGGASKLFKAFRNEYMPKNILSYSDNDYFSGNIYGLLGFRYIKQVAQPYYWYMDNKEFKRELCQPHRLKRLFPKLYAEATGGKETYIMIRLGAKKVYRRGNTRWEWVDNQQSV